MVFFAVTSSAHSNLLFIQAHDEIVRVKFRLSFKNFKVQSVIEMVRDTKGFWWQKLSLKLPVVYKYTTVNNSIQVKILNEVI